MEEHPKIDSRDFPENIAAIKGGNGREPSEERRGPPAEQSCGVWRLALNRINAWIFINKIFTLSIVGGFLLLGMAVALWALLPGKGPAEKKSGISTQAFPADRYGGARLDGFVVDVKDDGGNLRVLICDIVLEPIPGQSIKGAEARIDLRQVIYRVLQSRQVVQLISPEGRTALKHEIQGQAVRLLGEGKVKEVYFTRYTVL
ncbi:MAG: flagellar basal body-associated FliL family protein [Deltaproteobacteria bacterium]|nr:flagellar basal body-associated FliL family protein [Deltaproteobacteria bacterium]